MVGELIGAEAQALCGAEFSERSSEPVAEGPN